MRGFRFAIIGAAHVSCLFGAIGAQALTLNLIDTNHNLAGTIAGQDLQIAANYWQSMLTSNVTVNISVGYSALGKNVIASSSANSAAVSAASVYQQLAATGNSALDAMAVANLRPLDANGSLSFITDATVDGNVSKTVKVYDNDGSFNNKNLQVNTSVLKALGLGNNNPSAIDAQITFSSNFAFDFNPVDGIQSDQMDFVGVAIHELGHALGFTSGVDDYDYYTQANAGGGFLNSIADFTTLDLFRYSSDPKNLVPGSGPALDLSSGGSPFFSIDGATSFNGARFATGVYGGDGRQASHWKDSSGCGAQIGIMDPTFCQGQMGTLTDDDIAAMDALGWNVRIDALHTLDYAMTTAQIYALMTAPPPSQPSSGQIRGVPEPASWALLLFGFGLIGALARMQRRPYSAQA